MKTLVTPILVFLCFLTCCTNNIKLHELNIPSQIVIKHTGKELQFSGSSVFIVKPEGFQYMPSLIRIWKNDDTYLQCAELPANFIKQKLSMIQGLEGLKSKGFELYFEKEFKLGEFDAFIIYGSNSKPNSDQIALVYGNDSSTVILTAIFNRNDEVSKNQMLESMLTSYLDKNKKPDYTELTNFSVDLTNTAYKFNSNISNMFIYTINGEGNYKENSLINSFMIYSLPPLKSFEVLKKQAKSFLKNVANSGVKFSNQKESMVKINDKDSYEITVDGIFQGKPNKCYLVVTGDEKSSIFMCGTAYTDIDKNISTFKLIATTLRTKELK